MELKTKLSPPPNVLENMKWTLVTPDMAKIWIETNPDKNRSLRWGEIAKMTRDMINGLWNEGTGQPIQFAKMGNKQILINGQHRMWAIVESGVSLHFIVMENMNYERDMAHLDMGKARSAADVFKLDGIKNPKVLSSAIKIYYMFEHNYIGRKERVISSPEILQIYKQTPAFWQSVHITVSRWFYNDKGDKEALPLINYVFIALYAHLLRNSSYAKNTIKNRDVFENLKREDEINKINRFIIELCRDGEAKHSTVKLLRRTLFDDSKIKSKNLNFKFKLMYLIKTWNAYIEDRELKNLKYSPDIEEMPTFK